jgi:hypothetical protein
MVLKPSLTQRSKGKIDEGKATLRLKFIMDVCLNASVRRI